ncbi:hypothetical protein CPB84DRAFT_90175 [Gymnopilus junonius]|uniref:Uncharacterized protein n=1 Tax=Gymnopilus junonius TaxID=109634 RepID=A0A9P5P3W1_GYMJU|nr:hypothetical protein CPB84DRAFT_90175 [Gymnopilus junonius]
MHSLLIFPFSSFTTYSGLLRSRKGRSSTAFSFFVGTQYFSFHEMLFTRLRGAQGIQRASSAIRTSLYIKDFHFGLYALIPFDRSRPRIFVAKLMRTLGCRVFRLPAHWARRTRELCQCARSLFYVQYFAGYFNLSAFAASRYASVPDAWQGTLIGCLGSPEPKMYAIMKRDRTQSNKRDDLFGAATHHHST